MQIKNEIHYLEIEGSAMYYKRNSDGKVLVMDIEQEYERLQEIVGNI